MSVGIQEVIINFVPENRNMTWRGNKTQINPTNQTTDLSHIYTRGFTGLLKIIMDKVLRFRVAERQDIKVAEHMR